VLLKGYELQHVYNTDEMGVLCNCVPGRTLTLKGQYCHRGRSGQREGNSATVCAFVCVNGDGSNKQVLIMVGKPLHQHLKNVKNFP
jgi:hypothetical protein